MTDEIRAYDWLRHVGKDELPSERSSKPQVEIKGLDAIRVRRLVGCHIFCWSSSRLGLCKNTRVCKNTQKAGVNEKFCCCSLVRDEKTAPLQSITDRSGSGLPVSRHIATWRVALRRSVAEGPVMPAMVPHCR